MIIMQFDFALTNVLEPRLEDGDEQKSQAYIGNTERVFSRSHSRSDKLSSRKRRLLSLWEAASSVLELDHRVLHPAILRSLRLQGDNRFLRPPDLLVPKRWLLATVGDFSDGVPALTRSTRAALLDAQHLEALCQRLLQENASSSYHAEYEAETIVLRGSAIPITRLTNQRARRALDSARLQEHPVAELAARWISTVDVPHSIPWLTCVATAFRGTTQMSPYGWPSMPYHILTILPRGVPTVPPVFASCEMPLDLQAWLFGIGLHPEAVKLTSVAKATIYKYHHGLEVGNASHLIGLPTLWERTLGVHRWRSLSRVHVVQAMIIMQFDFAFTNVPEPRTESSLSWKESLENSVIAGVPQISRSSGWVKFVKICLFLFCWTGFFYQALEFLLIYFNYPIVLDIEITYPDVMDLPAITMCFTNCIAAATLLIKPPYLHDLKYKPTRQMLKELGSSINSTFFIEYARWNKVDFVG
ncbi:hypothetical protein LAZ67_3002900 [Cordylochernes scorpioides]|uniref:Uncharacterized protein n=1 Tax=Cordylochernes scorpioides TaxID=51811 RepID=A0ABY6K8B9_9ARAC|nr:hypothetical protein LAZ67_3002900 [Cordylochernes scorpioides]